jgi:hypothetical protein
MVLAGLSSHSRTKSMTAFSVVASIVCRGVGPRAVDRDPCPKFGLTPHLDHQDRAVVVVR